MKFKFSDIAENPAYSQKKFNLKPKNLLNKSQNLF